VGARVAPHGEEERVLPQGAGEKDPTQGAGGGAPPQGEGKRVPRGRNPSAVHACLPPTDAPAQGQSVHDSTAHDSTAHDFMAHDSTAHDSTAHDSMAHDSMVHDSTAHDYMAHDSTTHDSTTHDSTAHDSHTSLGARHTAGRLKPSRSAMHRVRHNSQVLSTDVEYYVQARPPPADLVGGVCGGTVGGVCGGSMGEVCGRSVGGQKRGGPVPGDLFPTFFCLFFNQGK